jgi:hypothetical protein
LPFLQQFIFLVSPWITMVQLFYSNHFIFFVQDFLEDLWSRVQDLSNNGWKLDSGNGVLAKSLYEMGYQFIYSSSG